MIAETATFFTKPFLGSWISNMFVMLFRQSEKQMSAVAKAMYAALVDEKYVIIIDRFWRGKRV